MTPLEPDALNIIKSLVGNIQFEDLHYVESFISDRMAVFLPVGGYCGYSLTKDHTHPTSMFTIHFDNLGLLKLGSEIHHSKPETTFFLPPNIPHQEMPNTRPSRFIALFISNELLSNVSNEYGCHTDQIKNPRTFSTPHALLDTVKIFMEETKCKYPGQSPVIEGMILRIVHILVRMLFDIDTANSINPELITENFRINRVLNYIHNNLDSKITIEQLASIANFSPSHFSQIFNRETRESPHRYILITRLLQSQKLIMEGKQNLTEIAYQCGFSSSSHFASAFQKEFSISPSNYKKRRL